MLLFMESADLETPGIIFVKTLEESANLWLDKGFSDDEDFCHTATREGNTFWKSIIFVQRDSYCSICSKTGNKLVARQI